MVEIFNLPRMTALEIYRLMEIIDNCYTHLDELDRTKYWKLQDEDLYPKPLFELPASVMEAAKFVHNNFQPEMETCRGVLIMPARILHNGWFHKRVRVIRRDSFAITMIEIEKDVWFLVQTCRTRFFEEPKDPAWFLIDKDHLPKICQV